jgi:hypothetical protein
MKYFLNTIKELRFVMVVAFVKWLKSPASHKPAGPS